MPKPTQSSGFSIEEKPPCTTQETVTQALKSLERGIPDRFVYARGFPELYITIGKIVSGNLAQIYLPHQYFGA
jgi:hypothetical protein